MKGDARYFSAGLGNAMALALVLGIYLTDRTVFHLTILVMMVGSTVAAMIRLYLNGARRRAFGRYVLGAGAAAGGGAVLMIFITAWLYVYR